MADSTKLRNELASLLNRHSRENASNTPDFVLADYLIGCLEAFEKATQTRDGWWGFRPQIATGGSLGEADDD